MKIKTILLDQNNAICINGISIGEGILSNSKDHLWDERQSKIIDVIVIHYISAINIIPDKPYKLPEILNIFVEYGVSSHYLISRYGVVYQLVPEEKKAWHCGASIMPYPDRRVNVNDFSIGIELVATEKSGFTESQYQALSALCFSIELRYGSQFSYVGHDQVAGTEAVAMKLRNCAKIDPGKNFNWTRFLDDLESLRITAKECKLQ